VVPPGRSGSLEIEASEHVKVFGLSPDGHDLAGSRSSGGGAAICALLRYRGMSWWGAILPTLPVLFDSYELHLEHMVSSDPLFMTLPFRKLSDQPASTTPAPDFM